MYKTLTLAEDGLLELSEEIDRVINHHARDYDVIHVNTFIDDTKFFEYRAIIILKRKERT